MTDTGTVPMQRVLLPVRGLKARVVTGADQGKEGEAKGDTLSVGTASDNDLVLTDPTVSRYHVELAAGPRGILVRDLGSTNGTFVSGVCVMEAHAPIGVEIAIGDSRLKVDEAADRSVEMHDKDELFGLIGRAPAMRQLMAQVSRVATQTVSVLLQGESGTGKEVVARALHAASPRARGPFVTVDCGSLSPTLIASELFGHERGAFTGATHQHIGACERASGGTLFLDEIGELPPALQANLLGVLERRRLKRVGGQNELPVDIRVVSATHHDLRSEVNSGSFRLDLYYRLAVVVLKLPALRDHTIDIPLLVEHFLRGTGHDGPVSAVIPQQAMESLARYRWPGNVRELRNLVEASVAMGLALALPDEPAPAGTATGADLVASVLELPYHDARSALLESFEGRYLKALLERVDGNVSEAARKAGVDRSHLTALIKRHGLR